MGKSAMIKVQVINKEGTIIAEAAGTKEVNLPVSRTYEEGDRVVFLADETPAFYVFQADDALGEALVYVTGEVSYEIPFGEKKVCYSPKIFSGESHLITARKAREWEYESYRNLAVNVMDQHGDTNCYPHATANVETRGESVFAARNAIDGVTSNHSHGYWPYGSWGINRNPQATMRVDFGREVTTDRIEIYTRADFPHDAWWTKATVRFSDDTTMICDLVKTDEGQEFTFPPKKVRWVQLEELIKADDPSPFPALSQLKVYGK